MSLAFLRGQAAYMRQRGLVLKAVSSPGGDLEDFSRNESVPVTAIEMARRVTPLKDIAAVVRIWHVLHQERPTIVHAHTPKGGLLGMIAAALARVPVRVYHLRGLPLLGANGLKRRLLWSTEWVACRLAHRVLCVSASLREMAVAKRICEPAKIKVLLHGSGNGVDGMTRFNPDVVAPERPSVRARLDIPESATVIGFVGRIVRDKGIVELTEAWLALRPKYPKAHLVLVGPEEVGDPVPSAILAALRRDPRVHLLGMDWNTAPLYAAMDVVVLPSYREGFPNVPLEAAAMRLPVVATRVPGCLDAVVDGVTGILVPQKNSTALAAAMERYLADSQLREEHGQAARQRVLHEFKPEAVWEAVYLEYRNLLVERGARGYQALPQELTA